ncbi:gliding motility-associated C-terminal domain-containing protein [Winogradskyella litoriviva]|uniref:Gliding motility-associated C-terminal domain-containing protein n=1 Tax=Winogradskyella litoriviva TaxID=1220182 RepID=A0ABX2E831_9FLAO|nr:gliding motility-associated C-terminal domain-containing protein [Winogradskyella litoriviva]NRD24691.1 gliding motility-associated C-terminal domain-containing protein [Winogradskyella litoriviva]
MKAKKYSFKSHSILLAFLLFSIIGVITNANAQCPTVTNSSQSFCNVQSLLVGDLIATDNGGGVVWYDEETSTIPLSNTDNLINGEDYYADDNTGTCGTRARVDVTIYVAPTGDNFQGFCVESPSLATVGNLVAIGNDIQWYLSPSGGVALNNATPLIDGAIYYADQANPDGSCRTSRLAVLVNVGLNPTPTGDMIQEFCVSPGVIPTVGDLEASGTNNWYISVFSAFPLPSSEPLINGQTYYATTLDPPCESPGRLPVLAVLVTGPDPGEDGILEVCENNTSSTFDLFLSLQGTPESGGTWSPPLNSGTGVFDPNIDSPGDYIYTVASGNSCPDESATVTVNIIPEPNAGTNGSEILCNINDPIDLFLSLGGTPETGGIWSPALNSGTSIFNPAIDVSGTYTYTVSGTSPCIDATATVEVIVNEYQNAGEDASIDICDNDGTIDLFSILGGTPDTGGIWSPALTSGTSIFDPLVDPATVYTYSFTGSAPCPSDSATVSVVVNPLPDAGINSTLEICSNDFGTKNLFDSLGGTPETGGTWSPSLTSGTGVYDPAIDSPGIYTYTLLGTAPCPNVSSEVNVIIIPEPNAGINATINLCDNEGPVDLFTNLGGTPDIGGTWSPMLNSGTNIFDPLIDPVGTYTYTVTGTSPCADASASITITVSPFLNAGSNGSVTACTADGTINLFDSLGGTPEAGGTWTPALASGTGIFDPLVDAEAIYTYTITGTGPCSDDTATVNVTIEVSPDAGLDGTLDLCNLGNTVNLFDSLQGSPQAGGTWSPSLNSNTGIFDPNIDTAGVYTYTVNSVNCGSSTANVAVTVEDANNAGSNTLVEICAMDAPIDLFNNLGGTPDLGGTWSPSLFSGTGIFDPSIDNAGVYTYSVSNSSSCPVETANVTVTILEEPNAGNNGTLDLCTSTGSVDLFDYLTNSPETGGTWSPSLASGTGVFDPTVDPAGSYLYTLSNACGTNSAKVTVTLSTPNDAGLNSSIEFCITDSSVDLFNSLGGTPESGGTWSPTLNSGTGVFDPSIDNAGIYTYTVSNPTSSCPSAIAEVIVTIDPIADAGNNGTLNLCNSTATQDLFNSLSGTPQTGGTWSPTLASGTSLFDPNIDPEGTYIYTITNACGSSSASVEVSFTALNDAGTNGTIDFCATDPSADLFDSLGGTPQLGGTWSPALASGTGVFNPAIDSEGIYTYTISSSSTNCPDATAMVEVSFTELPDAGNNGVLDLCTSSGSIDLFDSINGNPEMGGVWSPALTSGTGIFDPATDSEGTYTYTLTNTCGTNSADVTVTFSTPNDAGTDSAIEFCITDSSTDLFNSLGGTPQTGGTWSPSLTSGTGVFDPAVDSAGTYTYTVTNINSSCPSATSEVVVSIDQLADAGNDGSLNICNSSLTEDLFNSLTGSPQIGGTWSPTLTSGSGIFDPNSDPEGIYTYTVTTACGTSSANVTVSFSALNDAGTDGAIEFCNTDSPIDLFNSLGGTPQTGGTWTPALASGTGVFNPTLDTAGTYTYTVTNSSSSCPDATANVTVTLTQLPDAGNNGILDLCIPSGVVDLFDSLSGTPQLGGTWSPALTSGSGLFDVNTDSEGIYSYTLTNSCGSSSATVEVSFSTANNAGTNGSIQFCANDIPSDLFASLGGTPDTGGTWTPALNSGNGLFDPSIDSAGIYTYSVSDSSSSCPVATAEVEVSIITIPSAGSDAILNICIDNTNPVDLFNSLGGAPELGGTWSPTLSSGTGVFDPLTDSPGVYTYSIVTTECSTTSLATVTVNIVDFPDVTGLTMAVEDDNIVCVGLEDAIINITGATLLADGNYIIVYQLSLANSSTNTVEITVSGGNASFTIPQDLLQNPGETEIALTQLFLQNQTCGAITDSIEPIKILVQEVPTPSLIENGAEFCIEDEATIADLTNNIEQSETIIWYNEPINGIAYSNSEELQEDTIYYGVIRSEYGCESNIRLEVTVSFIECIGDLVIPDGFSPNGDTINDEFNILFLRDLYPNFKLSIFNRYGNIVYEGDKDSSNWDGTSKNSNRPLPVGVYFYILEFNDGTTKPVQGRVYLSR